jgi:4-amino-4-deoxy-L-arabinose transferase-like glycosyltransferase
VDRVAAAAPLWILGYFALNALLRSIVPGGLGVDEAELVLHAQSLELAYGPQPPLYGWLQAAAFGLFGLEKAALALVKNAVLAGAFLGVWATARRAGADARLAFAAVLAMALIPGITWEAQRALAHTPLALAAASVALAAFVVCRRRGGALAHLLLGAALAVAALSYWSAAFVGFGIVATLVFRRRAPWRDVALVPAPAVLLVAPTALWYGLHLDALGEAAGRVEANVAGPAATLAALGEATAATLALPLVALALLLARPPTAPGATGPAPGVRADLAWVVGLGAAAFGVLALAAGLEEVKERYLTPVAFAVPLLMLACFPRRLTAARTRIFAVLVGMVALGVSAGLQWNWRIGDDEPPPQAAPFAPLAARLAADGEVVFAASEWVGGNLRFRAPALAVLTPENAAMRLDVEPPVQLVWQVSRGDDPPPELLALFAERFGRPPRLGGVDRLAAPFARPFETAEPFALHRAVAR